MASGHVNRIKGRTHGCTDQACDVKILLANSEPFSNRISSVKSSLRYRSPRGSWFSPRSALAAASSGPKRRLSNVHNGLVEVALCGPTASGGVARTLAPEGKLTVPALSRYGFFLTTSGDFFVRIPAERLAGAPDAVQDDR